MRMGSRTFQKPLRFSESRDGTQEQASAWSNRLCIFTEKKRRVRDTGDRIHMERDATSANLP